MKTPSARFAPPAIGLLVAVLIAGSGFWLTPPGALAAPTFTVNSTADVVASAPLDNGKCETAPGNNVCTLRAAIMKANHTPGGGATIIVPAGTYTLTITAVLTDDESSGDLNISQGMSIEGAGSNDTIIDGNGSVTQDRVFRISGAAGVNISGLTIRDGSPAGLAGGGRDGGGILNYGNLTLTNSIVTGNVGDSGGGIRNIGNLVLTTSAVSGNTANNDGGGIISEGALTLTNSSVSANIAYDGGGLSNTGALVLNDSSVSGNTANDPVINGPGGNGGGIATAGTLVLKRSTLSGNHASGYGGGIQNGLTLTLTNSSVSGNFASQNGGGIDNLGTMALSSSTVASNTAVFRGGGIHNDGAATLDNSVVRGNTVPVDGAGIENASVMTLTASTVSGNTANNNGGGIDNIGSLSLNSSTVSDNTALHDGGGIESGVIPGSSVTVVNSTISGNNSWVDGGGIYLGTGTTSLFNATVTANVANSDASGAGVGGGVANGGGTFNFRNSIVAYNLNLVVSGGHFTVNFEDCSGALTSQDYNLVYEPSDCTISGTTTHNITGTNPLLGLLQNNGGATDTHAPALGSPAIDAGNPAGCTDGLGALLKTDQRGAVRPQGSACDIGAYEYGAKPTLSALNPSSTALNGPAFVLTLNGSDFISGATARWNAITLTTTFISGTQLSASVPVADLTATGAFSITVQNPGPGDGVSNALLFLVQRRLYLPLIVR